MLSVDSLGVKMNLQNGEMGGETRPFPHFAGIDDFGGI
jgi:hypothetical protein